MLDQTSIPYVQKIPIGTRPRRPRIQATLHLQGQRVELQRLGGVPALTIGNARPNVHPVRAKDSDRNTPPSTQNPSHTPPSRSESRTSASWRRPSSDHRKCSTKRPSRTCKRFRSEHAPVDPESKPHSTFKVRE